MFEAFKRHWERRRRIRFDRTLLERRARRFLKNYLEADDTRKSQFYRAVEDISKKCQPTELGLTQSDLDAVQLAEATSDAAVKMVMQLEANVTNDRRADFLTDAYATVAIAYRRAAGIYVADAKMQELGTAAVHLLTMATSYTSAQKE